SDRTSRVRERDERYASAITAGATHACAGRDGWRGVWGGQQLGSDGAAPNGGRHSRQRVGDRIGRIPYACDARAGFDGAARFGSGWSRGAQAPPNPQLLVALHDRETPPAAERL